MKSDLVVQLVCADEQLAREYAGEFRKAAPPVHLRRIARFSQARAIASGVSVFLLDQSGLESRLEGQVKQNLRRAAELLAEVAPVVVVAAPARQSELTALITSGLADFVARTGDFAPVAVALVERRVRLGGIGAAQSYADARGEAVSDFGEIFRHEVNNPLTGILGNAEMLLARRDHLPPSAIERLETIAELAVRLRETVRRLSSAVQLRRAG